VIAASTYLQTILGLSFASARQAWRCCSIFVGVADGAVVAAVTAPPGVTAGATGCATAAVVAGTAAEASFIRPWVCQSDVINSQASLAVSRL
jgi:hypothetical protein